MLQQTESVKRWPPIARPPITQKKRRVVIDWSAELTKLQEEQRRDLETPELAWWEAKPLTEEEYMQMLAENHGASVAVL